MNKKYIGTYIEFDVVNKNGRIYPYQTTIKAIKKYKKEYIDNNKAFGILGILNSSEIPLNLISHKITRLWEENNKGYAEIEILNTPKGKHLQELVNTIGSRLRLIPCGIGNIDENSNVTDFTLSAIVIDSDSAFDCGTNDWLLIDVKKREYNRNRKETIQQLKTLAALILIVVIIFAVYYVYYN